MRVVIDKSRLTDYIIVSILTVMSMFLLYDMEKELWRLKDWELTFVFYRI